MKEKVKDYQKLLEEFKVKNMESFTEALKIYPSKHLISNVEEWEKMIEKQGEYSEAKKELWFQSLKNRYNLTDYELAKLREKLLLDFLRVNGDSIRIIAGITMIIGAVIGFTLVRAIYMQAPESLAPYEALLKWLSTFWAVFVGIGGVYTLKRKAWKVCLASSILLIPVGILPFLALGDVLVHGEEINIPFAIIITLFLLLIVILPVVIIGRKKGEWER